MHARNDARSSSAICDGPSSPIETPACEPQRRMSACEIAAMRTKSYARVRKAANVDANGFHLRTCRPDGGRDQLLLGDVHLEVALGDVLCELFGVGRVAHLAVERDDVAARLAQRDQRVAVRLAGRDLVADVVRR